LSVVDHRCLGGAMIVRIWHGVTSAAKADEYHSCLN
jgi:hypothetical protein